VHSAIRPTVPGTFSALDAGEWSASRPHRFNPGKRAAYTHSSPGRFGEKKNPSLPPGVEP